MKWIEEIIKVLKQNNGEAMHYATIAELVVENNPEITETNATPNCIVLKKVDRFWLMSC